MLRGVIGIGVGTLMKQRRGRKKAIKTPKLNARRIASLRYPGGVEGLIGRVSLADEIVKEVQLFFRAGRVPLNIQKMALEQALDEVEDDMAKEGLSWAPGGSVNVVDRNRLDEDN